MTNEQGQVAAARAIATIAHRGQTDKAGEPYIGHPTRVASRVLGDGWDVVAAAYLHGVLEDSDITAGDIRAAGIDSNVVEAVIALTRVDGEKPEDCYARVYASWTATRVKLADIADNLDPARLALLDDATIARLTRKYAKARIALGVKP